MEEFRTEEVKLSKEDVNEDTKEIAHEALLHLKYLTEEYVENISKMTTTYKKEFAMFDMGLTLSLALGPHPVVVVALGGARALHSSIMNVMSAMTRHVKAEENANG